MKILIIILAGLCISAKGCEVIPPPQDQINEGFNKVKKHCNSTYKNNKILIYYHWRGNINSYVCEPNG